MREYNEIKEKQEKSLNENEFFVTIFFLITVISLSLSYEWRSWRGVHFVYLIIYFNKHNL